MSLSSFSDYQKSMHESSPPQHSRLIHFIPAPISSISKQNAKSAAIDSIAALLMF